MEYLTSLYCKDMNITLYNAKIFGVSVVLFFYCVQLFSYVADVLVTEAFIRLIAKFCEVDLEAVATITSYWSVSLMYMHNC